MKNTRIIMALMACATIALTSCNKVSRLMGRFSEQRDSTIIEVGAEEDGLERVDPTKEREIATIRAFIEEIYAENSAYDIFDEEWIHTHCTPGLQDYLQEMYDYDGEGYAMWEIGGWVAGEDLPTSLVSVDYDGDFYYARLAPGNNDWGISGIRTIRLGARLDGDNVVLTSVKWTTDFTGYDYSGE